MHRVVIIGGGYAGLMTAIRLSHKHPSAQITLINPIDRFTERIRLHQAAAGENRRAWRLSDLLRGTGVQFQQGWVTLLHPDQKLLTLQTEQGLVNVAYDYLVYALGSTTDRHSVPGIKEYAFSLDRDSVEKLRPALNQLGVTGGRVLVVGGGLTGIESASEIAERYPSLKVELLTQGQVGANLSPQGQHYLHQTFAHLGVTLHEHQQVTRVEAAQLWTSAGEIFTYDILIWTAGFALSPVAAEAGIAVNGLGQMIVDPELRSVSHPTIYGVGDAAAVMLASGKTQRLACATAMPIGAHAADNIAACLSHKPQTPFSFRYVLICISLGRRRALVQPMNQDDSPAASVITGMVGALIKEMICRYTITSFFLARRMGGFYGWPQYKSAPKAAIVR